MVLGAATSSRHAAEVRPRVTATWHPYFLPTGLWQCCLACMQFFAARKVPASSSPCVCGYMGASAMAQASSFGRPALLGSSCCCTPCCTGCPCLLDFPLMLLQNCCPIMHSCWCMHGCCCLLQSCCNTPGSAPDCRLWLARPGSSSPPACCPLCCCLQLLKCSSSPGCCPFFPGCSCCFCSCFSCCPGCSCLGCCPGCCQGWWGLQHVVHLGGEVPSQPPLGTCHAGVVLLGFQVQVPGAATSAPWALTQVHHTRRLI